ncbi:pyrroline-5-carboxylate reductase family protein [Nitratireductor alexandrii]|uniref:pyrroline-5-carboxylate reductase family protein n=1 Tax=Nitratireductor alexandrii TaxID=2448161 RepID=UPI000FD800C6|nr:pyrroline-5-carboxylate reductase dimerization domain-containing protein [Nitratireductor alexandrii]
MHTDATIGIIGGSGALGGAICQALLRTGTAAKTIRIANRSGKTPDFARTAGITVTTDAQALVDVSDLIVLSLPPALFSALSVTIRDQLTVSVMAGITARRIARHTGAAKIVRAMSSPVAARGLAYSPWFATDTVSKAEKAAVQRLFTACGLTDEIAEEGQIDHFTALTGPVPGFVAYLADCMIGHARDQGIAPEIAERAVRQLFKASGVVLSESPEAPGAHVRAMLAYAGTTAAGLEAMRASSLAENIARGLAAAAKKARDLG